MTGGNPSIASSRDTVRAIMSRVSVFGVSFVSSAKCLLIVLFALAAASSSFAQVGGSISGTVKDPSGAVVPGVSVGAMNTVLGTEFNTVTDGQGLYTFPKLPVGKYNVTMTLEGFKPQKRA